MKAPGQGLRREWQGRFALLPSDKDIVSAHLPREVGNALRDFSKKIDALMRVTIEAALRQFLNLTPCTCCEDDPYCAAHFGGKTYS